MTLTEKISSLTDLELAELWVKLLYSHRKYHQDLVKILDLYGLSPFTNQKKEIIEAMRAEIIKRYLNQNQI